MRKLSFLAAEKSTFGGAETAVSPIRESEFFGRGKTNFVGRYNFKTGWPIAIVGAHTITSMSHPFFGAKGSVHGQGPVST